jgi:DNA-binding transcriptional MerR regulator
VAARPTAAGGFTERRYSPVDLYELLALANLRHLGFSVQKIRTLLEVLRQRFGVRLFEVLGDGGKVTLLTDGREIFARTASGEFFNLLKAPGQPLLVIGGEPKLKTLSVRSARRKKTTKTKKSSQVAIRKSKQAKS